MSSSLAFANINDIFTADGIQFQVMKEDTLTAEYEVNAIHYDSVRIIMPDSVSYKKHRYAVTSAILFYNPQNCLFRHYNVIDLSKAFHITQLPNQISGLIAIDTLILPPNLSTFPANFYTSDSLSSRKWLENDSILLPGIHRIISTGTTNINNLKVNGCTSLLELDLSSYSTSFNGDELQSNAHNFAFNYFLQKCKLPNTITTFYQSMFDSDLRLYELSIPDNLESIYDDVANLTLLDTLRIGKNVKYITNGFAYGWYNLENITVSTDNPYFCDEDGVLFTKSKHSLWHYPFSRSATAYYLPMQTDSICPVAFAIGKVTTENYSQFIRDRQDSAIISTIICNPALSYIGYQAFNNASIQEVANFNKTRVKHIPLSCFEGSAIRSISLPVALETIDEFAFRDMRYLESLDFAGIDSIEVIREGAFMNCNKIQHLDLLSCNKISVISKDLCSNDTSLQYLALPRFVETIEKGAFENCTSLSQIICPSLQPIDIDSSVFAGVNQALCKLIVPTQSISLYKNAPIWQDFDISSDNLFVVKLELSDSIAGTTIGSGAYLYGEEVEIKAISNADYEFSHWSDGITDNPRTLYVTDNITLQAVFKFKPTTTSIADKISIKQTDYSTLILEDGNIYIRTMDGKIYDLLGNQIIK